MNTLDNRARACAAVFTFLVTGTPLMACSSQVDTGDGGDVEESALSLSATDKEIATYVPEYAETEKHFAQDGIAVVRTPVGGILLRAKSCERVTAALQAFKVLNQNTSAPGTPPNGVLPPTRKLASGWCEAKLDNLLSPYMAQTLDKMIDDNSVQSNCWGHAAAVTGIVTGVKELQSDGFTNMLRSPMCRKLSSAEPRQPGDVVVLRTVTEKSGTFQFEEIHTAIHISDELWSSKMGSGRFEISTPRAQLNEYLSYLNPEAPKSCLQVTPDKLTPEYLRTCKFTYDMYRCESVETYRARVGGSFTKYDELKRGLGSLLWETVHQQRLSEGIDANIPKGTAYVSTTAYEPVLSSVTTSSDKPPSARLVKRLGELRKDTWLRATYNTMLPQVPKLSLNLRANDPDNYEKMQTAYRFALAPLHAAIQVNFRKEEQALIDMLFLEAVSSQFSDLDNSNSPRARELRAPNLTLPTQAE
jgi:hypothetical protein